MACHWSQGRLCSSSVWQPKQSFSICDSTSGKKCCLDIMDVGRFTVPSYVDRTMSFAHFLTLNKFFSIFLEILLHSDCHFHLLNISPGPLCHLAIWKDSWSWALARINVLEIKFSLKQTNFAFPDPLAACGTSISANRIHNAHLLSF